MPWSFHVYIQHKILHCHDFTAAHLHKAGVLENSLCWKCKGLLGDRSCLLMISKPAFALALTGFISAAKIILRNWKSQVSPESRERIELMTENVSCTAIKSHICLCFSLSRCPLLKREVRVRAKHYIVVKCIAFWMYVSFWYYEYFILSKLLYRSKMGLSL